MIWKGSSSRLGGKGFRWLTLAFVGSMLTLCFAEDQRPNIVLILADDLGWSDIGCYGGEIPTPNIDRLARDGLRFTQVYNNSVCGPSRASLLTGLYAQRVGHSGRHWNEPTDYSRSITIGEALQRAGYRTAIVGKWQDPESPLERGFDRFYGPMTSGKISYFDEVGPNPFYLDRTKVDLPEDFYLTDELTDYAEAFIGEFSASPEDRSKPFFLYFSHIAPHWPLHAREQDIAPHRQRYRQQGWDSWRVHRTDRQKKMGLIPEDWPLSPMPAHIQKWDTDPNKDWQAELMAVYAAQVASIDASVGKIVEALKEAGRYENTLILFLSDNGAAHDGSLSPVESMLGFSPGAERNARWRTDGRPVLPGSGPDNMPGPPDTFAAYGLAWALTSNAPLRDTKLTTYEGGVRTPMVAHWPKGIRSPGRSVDTLTHVFDMMPTFLELSSGTYPEAWGVRRPLPLDGRSFAPVFHGKNVEDHEFLAWLVYQHRGLRSGRWKIVSREGDHRWELYDMKEDGTETRNLAAEHPEKARRLSRLWESWLAYCETR